MNPWTRSATILFLTLWLFTTGCTDNVQTPTEDVVHIDAIDGEVLEDTSPTPDSTDTTLDTLLHELDVDGSVEGKVELVEYDDNPTFPVYTGPAPDAIVAAWQGQIMIAETVADDEGHYSLSLPEGSYRLMANRHEWETAAQANVEIIAGNALLGIDFQLTSQNMADKPNLYLYPTETTRVQVEIGLNPGCEVTVSDPEYGTGWDVTIEPSGLIDGQHTFLFYEAEVPSRYRKHEGWVIPSNQVVPFFNQLMDDYGFTDAETFDFVDHWKDHLPSAPYYAVYPLTDAADLDPLATLHINPQPDSIFRLWFVISPEETAIAVAPAVVEPMTRQGFAAVEWGVIVDE